MPYDTLSITFRLAFAHEFAALQGFWCDAFTFVRLREEFVRVSLYAKVCASLSSLSVFTHCAKFMPCKRFTVLSSTVFDMMRVYLGAYVGWLTRNTRPRAESIEP